MNENLVGYLLDALDEEGWQDVESYLAANPHEGRRQLDLLRQALQPLAEDQDAIDPPAGLWVRTLARVAEYQCRRLPPAPAPIARRSSAPGPAWWRRADVVVAACILLCVGLLVPPSLTRLKYYVGRANCENNLRQFYTALVNYSDNHQGAFPDVAAQKPHDVAGIVVPVLNQEGLLGPDISVRCPAGGQKDVPTRSLHEVQGLDPEEFQRLAPTLSGCYAYSLGYQDVDGLHGPRFEAIAPENFYLPILADRPPQEIYTGALDNSPNHGGRGQNVLFGGGNSRFYTHRLVGPNEDDIYLSTRNKVEAGRHRLDTVLGESAARP